MQCRKGLDTYIQIKEGPCVEVKKLSATWLGEEAGKELRHPDRIPFSAPFLSRTGNLPKTMKQMKS